MKKLLALSAFAALVVAPVAHAADRTGFTLGARAAYGFPLGDVGGADDDANDAFDNFVDNAYPLWLELNYRFGPSFEAGAYFQYAFLNLGDDFGGDDGSDLRLGLQLNYIFTPGGSLSPWIGVGGGFEWLRGDTDLDPGNLDELDDTAIDGWDLMVQGGLDFHVADRFTIGPFATLTFGQFGDIEINDESTNIDDKAWHEWLQLGVRATFF
jgi:opacity protein-like surface antigen